MRIPLVPATRHLLRAKDTMDGRYADPLDVEEVAKVAGMSPAHFSREFRSAFGVTPHQYLLTRRLERAAALLRSTDRSVLDVCTSVGLNSVGSFTTSFKKVYGMTPTQYREAHPPTAAARLPTCVIRAYGRPSRSSSFREDGRDGSK